MMNETVVERLRRQAAVDREEVRRLLEDAALNESHAREDRETARTMSLRALEMEVGANIIEGAGLSVTMGSDGNPTVRVAHPLPKEPPA